MEKHEVTISFTAGANVLIRPSSQ